MNLKDLIDELNRNLSSVKGDARLYEMRMEIPLVEEIYWHLRQYYEKCGNQGRPNKQQEQSRERYRAGWEDVFGRTYSKGWWDDYGNAASREELREELLRKTGEAQRKREETERRAKETADRFWREQARYWESHFRQQQTRKDQRDPYIILGVRRGATKPEIIKAYRSLAMRLHPDRKGGSTEKFQDLQWAKQQLVGK
jgi:hypothetical protein